MPILRTDDVVLETDELPSQMPPMSDIIPPPFWPDRCIPLPPRPVEPQSDAQNFIERLWAFLTIKDLLDEKESALAEKKKELIELEVEDNTELPTKDDDDSEEEDEAKKPEEFQEFPKTPEMTNREKALELALRYNFVTELTSLIVVRPNATEEDEKEILEPVPVSEGGSRGCPGCHSMQRIQPMRMASPASFGGFSNHFSAPSLRGPPAPPISASGSAGRPGPPPMRRKSTGGTTRRTSTTTRRPSFSPTYDYAMDYDSDQDDVFGFGGLEEEAEPATTPEPKTSCEGSISLHDKTYLRGKNVTLTVSDLDLSGDSDINNSLTSLEVRGDCCWKIYTEPNNAGDSKIFREGEFKSSTQMGSLFRAASSVEMLFEC